MSLPTINDYHTGSHTWRGTYRDTLFEVAHHSITDFRPAGVWNFYVTFREEFFQRPEDWSLFDIEPEIVKLGEGLHEVVDYYKAPDLPWHFGPTFGQRRDYINRAGLRVGAIKIGCDYTHLWDEELGFPYTLESVTRDAHCVIDTLHERFPQKLRCAYDGTIDMPGQFYEPRHGNGFVHRKHIDAIRAEPRMELWLPKEAALKQGGGDER